MPPIGGPMTSGCPISSRYSPPSLWRVVMRALNRHVEREFNPDRKDKHWGRRKLARDRLGSLKLSAANPQPQRRESAWSASDLLRTNPQCPVSQMSCDRRSLPADPYTPVASIDPAAPSAPIVIRRRRRRRHEARRRRRWRSQSRRWPTRSHARSWRRSARTRSRRGKRLR